MKKIVIGTLCLLLGIFLVFNNLGFVNHDIYRWVISWQSLLIAIGFIQLFDGKYRTKESGAILIIIGLLFLLPRIFHIPSLSSFIFPAIIIGIGLLFLFKSNKKKPRDGHFFSREGSDERSFAAVDGEKYDPDGEGVVKREFVFSGSKEKWQYSRIRKVEVEAIFSGLEIDLSQIDLADDADQVHVKITSVFSGVTLYIPTEWNLVIQKTGVFGGFTDRRPDHLLPDPAAKTVVLELEAVFGGGEIRCYE